MVPDAWIALLDLLSELFDPNELRTLFSTDLYLGDLSSRLPPPGSAEPLVPAILEVLVQEGRIESSFFQTLRNLRRDDQPAVARTARIWFARKVLLLHSGSDKPEYEQRARQDARLAATLAAELARAGHRPLLPYPTPALTQPSLLLERGLEDCDAVVLLLSAASASSSATHLALQRVTERRVAGPWPALLTLTTDVSVPPKGLTALLDTENIWPCQDPAAFAEASAALQERLQSLAGLAASGGPRSTTTEPWPAPLGTVGAYWGPGGRPAPVPRDEVTRRALAGHGLDFCQLLLENAPLVAQVEGRLTVEVDASDADKAVLDTATKASLWIERLGSRRGMARARAWDAYFRARLLDGVEAAQPEVPCPSLRWGGAGVLAEVRWRGRDWVPLFFRDIPPVGWNLSLGASSMGEGIDPATWGVREFQEELLVLGGQPSKGQPLALRPLLVDTDRLGPDQALAMARHNAMSAVALRERHDGIPLVSGEPSTLDELGWVHRAITCDDVATNTDLTVKTRGITRRMDNLLVAPMPLELGIDVVRVLRFELGDDDSLLDGEILERSDAEPELVRMPVALVAADTLRRIFGPNAPPPEWTDDLPASATVQGLNADDVHVFPWDLRRRRELALGGGMSDSKVDPREQERHRRWLDRFGPHFLDTNGDPRTDNPSPLFVGATAFLLSCWARQPR